jgi:hypothetical protein
MTESGSGKRSVARQVAIAAPAGKETIIRAWCDMVVPRPLDDVTKRLLRAIWL